MKAIKIKNTNLFAVELQSFQLNLYRTIDVNEEITIIPLSDAEKLYYESVCSALNLQLTGESITINPDVPVDPDPGNKNTCIVGDKEYPSVTEALKDMTEAEVKLSQDIEENISITDDQSIKIDLSKKSINGGSTERKATILNNGNLTVSNGTLKREDNKANGYYVIDNQGNLTIDGNDIMVTNDTNQEHGSSLIRNAGNDKKSKLTINGGTFTQNDFIVLKNDDNGIVVINGGLFKSTDKGYTLMNWSQLTINGGEINGSLYACVWSNKLDDSVVEINDVKFTGLIKADRDSSSSVTKSPHINIHGGTFEISKLEIEDPSYLTINGGTFNIDVSEYVADGFECVASDNKFIVQKKSESVEETAQADSVEEQQSQSEDEAVTESDVDLGSLKKDELVKLAEEKGIDPSGKTKADLIDELSK